jgi:hypothetical protein
MVRAEHQLQCKVVLDEAMDYGENQTVKLNQWTPEWARHKFFEHVRGI